jgi:hypothetical protein
VLRRPRTAAPRPDGELDADAVSQLYAPKAYAISFASDVCSSTSTILSSAICDTVSRTSNTCTLPPPGPHGYPADKQPVTLLWI